MSIDNLTIGEAKELAALFGATEKRLHPFTGENVIVALPHGFVFFGILQPDMTLCKASNIRYWEKRDGGLPEFAKSGPKSNDKIDKLAGKVDVSKYLFIYQAGDWNEC